MYVLYDMLCMNVFYVGTYAFVNVYVCMLCIGVCFGSLMILVCVVCLYVWDVRLCVYGSVCMYVVYVCYVSSSFMDVCYVRALCMYIWYTLLLCMYVMCVHYACMSVILCCVRMICCVCLYISECTICVFIYVCYVCMAMHVVFCMYVMYVERV